VLVLGRTMEPGPPLKSVASKTIGSFPSVPVVQPLGTPIGWSRFADDMAIRSVHLGAPSTIGVPLMSRMTPRLSGNTSSARLLTMIVAAGAALIVSMKTAAADIALAANGFARKSKGVLPVVTEDGCRRSRFGFCARLQ